MNYMKQVAQMLDVELEEEFKIEGYDNNLKFKFSGSFFLQSCGYGWVQSCSLINVLEGTTKIIKLPKPILDDVEKEYLSNVIKPFRNKVICIYKQTSDDCEDERIEIAFNDYSVDMTFPYFEKGTMYKGMKTVKEYSLEELGL